MEYYQNPLFYNITHEEFISMRPCLGAWDQGYPAGETVCTFGESFHSVGILISGTASVVRFEVNGGRTILEHLEEQDIFGDILTYQNPQYESVMVVSNTPCHILFLDYERILSPCAKSCRCHRQLIQNMLSLLSQKTMLLGERVEVLSKRSTREKLMAYFHQLSARACSPQFELPFTQSDLADYLSVDRSAMGRELKKMREDGLISIQRRQVKLL